MWFMRPGKLTAIAKSGQELRLDGMEKHGHGNSCEARETTRVVDPQQCNRDDAAHAFYERLNAILEEHGFDGKTEQLCRRYYKGPYGGSHPRVALSPTLPATILSSMLAS
jgi:hypothetical protein